LASEPEPAGANRIARSLLVRNVRRMLFARLRQDLTEAIGLLKPVQDRGLKYFLFVAEATLNATYYLPSTAVPSTAS